MIDLELYRARVGCYSHHSAKRIRPDYLSRNSALLEMLILGYLQFTKNGLLCRPAGSVCFVFKFVCLILYTYILCLNMAFTVDIIRSESVREIFSSSPFRHDLYTSYWNVNINMITMLNLFVLSYVILAILTLFQRLPRNFKVKHVLKYLRMYSMGSKVSHLYTMWIASLNMVLIVLVNPSILNPGPDNPPNLTIFYQNVRGLIPFTELGKPSPMLDYTKLFELQSYVLYNSCTK